MPVRDDEWMITRFLDRMIQYDAHSGGPYHYPDADLEAFKKRDPIGADETHALYYDMMYAENFDPKARRA